MIHEFEHQFVLSEENQSKHNDDEQTFKYVNSNRSATATATSKLDDFMKMFIRSITNMKMTEADVNCIMKLSASLVENLNAFNLSLIEDDNGLTVAQTFGVTCKYVQSSIFAVNTKYKRTKNAKSNEFFVAPTEVAIGTRWELQKRKTNGRIIKIPRLIQSSFQYVWILKTLEGLFCYKNFSELYYEHNLKRTSSIGYVVSGTYMY